MIKKYSMTKDILIPWDDKYAGKTILVSFKIKKEDIRSSNIINISLYKNQDLDCIYENTTNIDIPSYYYMPYSTKWKIPSDIIINKITIIISGEINTDDLTTLIPIFQIYIRDINVDIITSDSLKILSEEGEIRCGVEDRSGFVLGINNERINDAEYIFSKRIESMDSYSCNTYADNINTTRLNDNITLSKHGIGVNKQSNKPYGVNADTIKYDALFHNSSEFIDNKTLYDFIEEIIGHDELMNFLENHLNFKVDTKSSTIYINNIQGINNSPLLSNLLFDKNNNVNTNNIVYLLLYYEILKRKFIVFDDVVDDRFSKENISNNVSDADITESET